jgi:GNAT superfamily N-acetyltransferase
MSGLMSEHHGQVDEARSRPEMAVQVTEVQPGTPDFGRVLALAAGILAQEPALTRSFPHARESHVVGSFAGATCTGFLRYLIQVIGAEEGRPAVLHHGQPLTEGYVEAFGVDPRWRRRGIGTALQQYAARQCRAAGCYQMRSRSPVTSTANYTLKIGAGYTLHPSKDNDSYYFLLRL